MPTRPQRRLKFVRANLLRLSGTECLARVQLEQPGSGAYVGTAVGANPDIDGLRTTAKATAAALMQASGQDHSLDVREVEMLDAFGHSAVLVHLGARLHHRTQGLMGLCVAEGDSTRAAALAVLHATNRVLDLG